MRALCCLALLLPLATHAASDKPAVIYAIGDIADCNSNAHRALAELIAADRARLPKRSESRLLLLGDLVYPHGTAAEFADCFDPVWGRFRREILAVPGNHDYATANGAPFYAYIGPPAAPNGYFSVDLGRWRILGLNSNIAMDKDSAQGRWLSDTLAGNTRRCTLAMWHHPRFSSGAHGNAAGTQAIWQALADARVAVALAGHDHHYERNTPLDAAGQANPLGTRSFVVGTGGASPYRVREPAPPITEARRAGRHGYLRLELDAAQYRWRFVSLPDGEVLDAGEGHCPPAPAG
ncbi:metallophosphoesterase [Niveibacterium sp. 24ML]|uniref:metallophosphoesterase family protein n=1 Tax=Niveibacterium sp. 24ML TaxID=2985512 RepID=UPI00226E216C|nr:metallophosphoesterase [Niveibacterium sp. 24ML]MCX9154935.1 metallophosphoesterase [Niveibacterium sp. 24ML]